MELEERLQLNPGETLLLVIDIQKDFLESQHGFTFFDADHNLVNMQAMVKEPLIPFIQYSLGAQAHVVYSKANYPIGKFPPPYDRLCSSQPGTDFYMIGNLIGFDRVRTFTKNEYDPFTNPDLRRYIQRNSIRNLILAGVTLTHCIKEAVKSAVSIDGLSVIVPGDCVGYRNEREQDAQQILAEYKANKRIVVVNSRQLLYK